MHFPFIIQHLGVSYLHSVSVWRAVETQRQRLADEVAKVVDWYRLNPEAKLRIGFVSFNYNNHPVSVLYPKIHTYMMHAYILLYCTYLSLFVCFVSYHIQNTLWSKCPCSTVTTSIIIYECVWWWGGERYRKYM